MRFLLVVNTYGSAEAIAAEDIRHIRLTKYGKTEIRHRLGTTYTTEGIQHLLERLNAEAL